MTPKKARFLIPTKKLWQCNRQVTSDIKGYPPWNESISHLFSKGKSSTGKCLTGRDMFIIPRVKYLRWIPPKIISTIYTLLETNSKFTPENGWLEDFLVSFWGLAYFLGIHVSFRECNSLFGKITISHPVSRLKWPRQLRISVPRDRVQTLRIRWSCCGLTKDQKKMFGKLWLDRKNDVSDLLWFWLGFCCSQKNNMKILLFSPWSWVYNNSLRFLAFALILSGKAALLSEHLGAHRFELVLQIISSWLLRDRWITYR